MLKTNIVFGLFYCNFTSITLQDYRLKSFYTSTVKITFFVVRSIEIDLILDLIVFLYTE